MTTKFAIMTASAKSIKGYGPYRHGAVVEYDPSKLPPGRDLPAFISRKARGMVRIHYSTGPCRVGLTERSAWARGLASLREVLADVERRHVEDQKA